MSQPTEQDFASLNSAKADFNSIYMQPDPRAYFSCLGGLNYMIPDVAHPIFEQVIVQLVERLGRSITVLDLGCSYGVNGAHLKFGISVEALRQRYASAGLSTCSSASLAALDRHFFASWPLRSDVRLIGLDVSRPALDYALSVGLLDDAIVADLETGVLLPNDLRKVQRADMIISTGCVGYVSERTFSALLAAFPNDAPPWIASFVLRMFPYNLIEQAMAYSGLVTEKLAGATFVQRRFRDSAEAEEVQENLRALGVDPTGKESEGLYHAEFFLSRPRVDIDATPLSEIVSIASGAGRLAGALTFPTVFERRDAAA